MNYNHSEFKNSAISRNPVRDGMPMLLVSALILGAVIALAIRCI